MYTHIVTQLNAAAYLIHGYIDRNIYTYMYINIYIYAYIYIYSFLVNHEVPGLAKFSFTAFIQQIGSMGHYAGHFGSPGNPMGPSTYIVHT